MGVKVEFDARALVAAFKSAERNMTRHIPVALKMGADLIAIEARSNHDYEDRDGTLTDSIEAEEVEGSFEQGTLTAMVSAGAPHAVYVEEGTDPHDILPKHRKALRWPVEGGFAFAGKVSHPGTRPYRYLANALEARLDDVKDNLQEATALAFAEAGFDVE